VETSVIPLRITGLVASKRVSSSFWYKVRVPKPPPVESLHRASESQGCRPERLSKASTHELCAAISRSCSPRGTLLTGTAEGSTIFLRMRAVVVLAEPCSPWSTSAG
jgi:hypothetical protein